MLNKVMLLWLFLGLAGYQSKTPLHLPFSGAWTVEWGGRTAQQNHHLLSTDMRYACDFVLPHHGDGSRNQDYDCFGRPILAPAGGLVSEAVDGIDDNRPGEPRPPVCGNHVVIDHRNGEFSYLCHFQKGSLAVKVGDAVKAGQLVGKCGNSGQSSRPHLHFHLQNAVGEGLPAQLIDYLADEKPVPRGEPQRGQSVRNQ